MTEDTPGDSVKILAKALRQVIDETIEASAGDLVHTPGGTWHTVHNASGAPAVLFNFRGGALPSRTEWRDA